MLAATSNTDVTDVVIVAIATLPAALGAVALFMRRMRGVEKNIAGIRTEVTTNHGKKAAEYLELIADVHEATLDNRLQIIEVKKMLIEHSEALTDHTRQDAENFDALGNMIQGKN